MSEPLRITPTGEQTANKQLLYIAGGVAATAVLGTGVVLTAGTVAELTGAIDIIPNFGIPKAAIPGSAAADVPGAQDLLPTASPTPTTEPINIDAAPVTVDINACIQDPTKCGIDAAGGQIVNPIGTEAPPIIPTITTTPTPGGLPTIEASPTPTIISTPIETVTATPSNVDVDKVTAYLEGLGIDINLPRADWAVTGEQLEAILKAQSGKSIDASHLVRIVEVSPTGEKTWNGWWMGEPAFPMRSDIVYDPNLHVHIDKLTGQPEFDPTKIFLSYDELSADQKKQFAEGTTGTQGLINIEINQPGVALFARKGGEVLPGDTEKNTQFFFGTPGAKVEGVEQLTVIPVPQELCESDMDLSGATRSFRQAVTEFRDNPQVQNGTLKVKWFNPETNKFETLDGRMLTKFAEQKIDFSVLERMPANTPLSPEDMAKRWGGQAEKWVVNPQTWEWFYESYELQPGVHYVNGVGAIDANGKLLVGAEQANRDTSKLFDFDKLDIDALVQNVKGTGSFQATLFARQGTMGDNATKNHSWYTWDQGSISLNSPGIEQMTWMPHNPSWCAPSDMPNELAARAMTLANEQPDRAITALYWDGTQFIQVVK